MSDSFTPTALTFDEIAADIRVPGAYDEIKAFYTNTGVLGYSPKALVIGQIMGGYLAVAGQVYVITRAGQANALFGPASPLAQAVEAFRAANTQTELHAMGVADTAGWTTAQGALALVGGLTASCTIAVRIGGRRIPVVLAAGSTLAQQALAVATAINADPYCVLSAGLNATPGQVTLACKFPGALGNYVDVRIGDDPTPPGGYLNLQLEDGSTVGFSGSAAPPTGGAGTPDVTQLLELVASQPFTDMAMCWNDAPNLATFGTELARRYNAMIELDAHGYVGGPDTFGHALSLIGGGVVNGPHLSTMPAYAAPSPPWVAAGVLCGVASFALGNDPARQLKTLALPGWLPPRPTDCFDDQERDILLRNGCSTFKRLSDGTAVIERVVTTYQKSVDGILDTAWLDIMTPKTMSRIRYDWINWLKLAYPRSKLVDDDSAAARYADGVVTCSLLKGSWASRCKLYEQLGWIEDAATTSAMAIFVRDGTDKNRVNSRRYVRIVGNLMVAAGDLLFEV